MIRRKQVLVTSRKQQAKNIRREINVDQFYLSIQLPVIHVNMIARVGYFYTEHVWDSVLVGTSDANR